MRRLVSAVVLFALTAGCSAETGGGGGGKDAGAQRSGGPASQSAASPSVATPTESPPRAHPSSGGKVTKTLVIFVENHTLTQMRDGMPYLNSLAQRYSYATGYTAMTHPSLPNYLAVAGGSTFGISDDANPSAHSLTGPSVFGQALAKGRTAKVYAEDQPSNCYPGNEGTYAVRHTGWPYFVAESSECRSGQVSSGSATSGAFAGDVAAGRLPNVGWLVPNLCHDAHDCELSAADNWLATMLPPVFAGPDWKSGRLAVVITADEDNRSGDNTVLTVVANPSLSGKVVTTPLNHYSLSGFLSAMSGSAPLRGAAGAPSFAAAFGLATP